MLAKSIHMQDVKTCLLCGNEGVPLYQGVQDRLFGVPGTWSLMCCPKCRLAWLNPRPLPEDIGKLYVEYHTHQAEEVLEPLDLRKIIKASILQTRFGYLPDGASRLLGRVLAWIGPLQEIAGGSVMWLKAGERGRLLDVGCGNGRFLAQMRELGWEVVGTEPDPEAVRIAKERFGLEVFQGTLEETRFPEDSFDVITMNHVIEHVPNPIELLAKCRQILKPGGKLVVTTPNIKSLGQQVFGEYWRGWEVPRHLFLFSLKSLQTCAERVGLRVKKLWTTSRGARWIWATSRSIQCKGKLHQDSLQRMSLLLRLEGLAFWTVEYLLSRTRDVGEELVLEALKD